MSTFWNPTSSWFGVTAELTRSVRYTFEKGGEFRIQVFENEGRIYLDNFLSVDLTRITHSNSHSEILGRADC